MEKFFIGRFPPPYGGATVKCRLIYNELSKYFDVIKFDTELMKKRRLLFLVKILIFLIRNKEKKGVVCVHTLSLFKLTKAISYIDKKIYKNISVFINGGSIYEK